MPQNFTQFAFTDSVKDAQSHYGSRPSNARMEASPDRFVLTEREIPFIQTRDSFYMATVGENGWPYVQFRGGPEGFLKVLGKRELGFADFRGNRQYISVGNLNAAHKLALILMDYPRKMRLKIWATGQVFDAQDRPDLVETLHAPDYKARVERVIVLQVQAYDWNCPQHITPRYRLDEIQTELR
ncbi:MAG: pyridoxamine 5'-phosphate oxidase family protein [Opitutales bacterium]